ncbi:MAG: T9SS type A sorting domain-containing protein [Candidatus Cloacimonadota bacterium]|nr:MAG: T9SS type A sorting domain-containing protein [Candidatus Cloacimonadota bacterium]
MCIVNFKDNITLCMGSITDYSRHYMKKIGKLIFFFLIISFRTSYADPSGNVTTEVVLSNDTKTVLRITFERPEIVEESGYKKIVFPLEGTTRSVGKPELPAVTRLIAIPDNATCNYTVISTKSYTLKDIVVIPYNRGTDYDRPLFKVDSEFYKKDIWYPYKTIEAGQPSILRDVRFIPLTIYPIKYNPEKREIRVIKEIEIELLFSYFNPQNVKIHRRETLSEAFEHLYKKFVINYESFKEGLRVERGSYLIIVPDALYNTVLPLADWKNRKGNRAFVKKTSETGFTNNQIKNYISNAYYTWEVAPDYVLLIGDVNAMSTFYDDDPRHGIYATDLPYSQLEGSDLFPDIFLGRISVDNSFELNVIISKIFGYERAPQSPATWLNKFLCVSGQDFNSQPETKIWVQEFVEDYGYTVDTLFARSGANATMISNAINNGRAYVNYRGGGWGYGWREPDYNTDDLFTLSNGWKLPVMTSLNCGAGKFNWGGGECFGEVWLRVGTPSTPKGGVAFIGASHWTYASRNNALDVGIYRAIFNDSLTILGQAMNAGKLFMFICYPEYDTTRIEYGVYHILGDPELNLWTDVPLDLTVSHPSIISCGNVGFDVSVKDNNSSPLKNALVCLVKGDEVYSYNYTDVYGESYFLITPTTPGTLSVTVTALNFIPYEAEVPVISNNIYIGYKNHFIDDDNSGGSSGNNDGKINPGETIEMPVVLKNFGIQTSYNVTALLKTTNALVTVTDSTENFGNILPGDTSISNEDYDFVVSDELRYGNSLGFSLYISDNDSTWYSYFSLPIFACNITYMNFIFYDGGNGEPEPGESGGFAVTLENEGNASALNLNATLSSSDSFISINDSLGTFGDISPGNSATNSSNRFNISISPNVHTGHKVPFTLYLTASGYYVDTLNFEITISPVTNRSPTGPDEYGYYAYDSYDTSYTEAPVYNWVELDPTYGGSGTILPLGEDGTATLSLPFTFKYYGINYDSISICANGWITVGNTNLGTYANWPIPDTYGPPAMIAPFWDDLSDSLPFPGHIYYKYESTNHWFIVEWSRIYHLYSDSIPHPADPETFEAIFYDPNYYSTITGDGEIVCQYKTIIYPLSSTIGIENEDENIGIQYLYNGTYADGASNIDDGLALKFTTDPPEYTGIEEQKSGLKRDIFLFPPYPNPFTTSTTITLQGLSEHQNTRVSELKIYDVSGRLVKDFSLSQSGDCSYKLGTEVTWDGKDNSGNVLQGGVYFIRLTSGKFISVRKVSLIR